MEETKKKKAYIIQFVVTTRVVADSKIDPDTDEGAVQLTDLAVEKMRKNFSDYLNIENLEYIEDDTECPYNPEFDN